jgi:ethanolaminephosphotransferase
LTANDKLHLLLGNAKQIFNIVTATFEASLFNNAGSQDCSNPSSDVERLGCDWRAITVQLDTRSHAKSEDHKSLLQALSKVGQFSIVLFLNADTDGPQWSRDAQEIMSSTASNYDMNKLIGGQVLALTSTALAVVCSIPILRRTPTASVIFALITIIYGIMMFASSYVEEEHNFWYWAASAWTVILFFKTVKKSYTTAFSTLVILLGLRIARRWNQTGQKFVGEPDIGRTFLSEHTTFLWSLILAAYFWNCYSLASNGFPHLPRKIARAVSQILMLLAATFKLAFTHEDAPELLDWAANKIVELTAGWSLVFRARAVYIGVGLALAQAIGSELWTKFRRHRFSMSHSPLQHIRTNSLQVLFARSTTSSSSCS